jgi:exopolyphosphatase/guanosine-5'-triphosphate,3'-diphosphate pyrophosphatase
VTRRRIKRLAAILRVADGFDRGHVGAVRRIKVRWMRRALRLTAVPASRARSIRLELWGANRKSRLLARLAGVPVEIVAPDGTVTSDSA